MKHTSVTGLAVLLLGCGEAQIDRRAELLVGIVEGQVLPDLDQARSHAETLHDRLVELCTSPDTARLDAAQAAWSDLRGPWKRLLALPIGPIADDGYEAAIDFWPARPSSIEGGVAAGLSSQAEIDALGVASKGMPAIEYLLWDPVGGDQAVLATLAGPRCQYATLLAADVSLRLTELDSIWTESFAAELEQTTDSEMYPDLAAAIDAVVNAMIAGLHDIDDMKLGKPLGLTSGTPDPELVESRFSDRSLADARDALRGFELAYLGVDRDHPGLTILVAQKSPEIDQRVREAITSATAALAMVPEPLRESISSDSQAVAEAAAAIHELRILLTADVASLLGVTVSLSDNDGD